jgi:hypothetical protein
VKNKHVIFGEFPDGSSIWRASISGRYDTQRKIQELAEHSYNHFYAIDVEAGEVVRIEG